VSPPTAATARPDASESRASLAAFLSFLFPGLGQAYNGQARLASLLAAPTLVLVLATVFTVVIASSRLVALLFDVRFLVGLIVLDVVLLAWRVIAVLQAHSERGRFGSRSLWTWLTAILLVVTFSMHALPAYYAAKAIDTLRTVALGGTHGSDVTDPFPDFSDLPVPSDRPDVEAGERVNILLVGVDSLPGRTTQLTDTMLVVSLDSTGTASALISVPRDLYGVPVPPDDKPYNQKLNSLMAIAASHPKEYPLGGVGTLKAAIGNLLGMPIHYFAAVNLLGFKQTVDAIGGVDIVVERPVRDPTYYNEFDQPEGFYIAPGAYHMNGHTALAFVRSRKGVGDSDFTRADRQQLLLTAIRAKLTAGNLLLTLPALLDAVKNTIATDVPPSHLAELAVAVQEADMSQLQRIVLQPPEYMSVNAHSSAGYILIPNLEAIRTLGQAVLSGEYVKPSPTP
jgi:LCP family protein required for cell wall assembly